MLKPESSSGEEPKEHPKMLDDQGPSFEQLMMLVFSGPMRSEHPDEVEEEDEMAAEDRGSPSA